MKILWSLAMAAGLASATVPAAGQSVTDGKFACFPLVASVCGQEGCRPVEAAPSAGLMVDFPARTYQRCSNGSCDTYRTSVTNMGQTVLAEILGTGTYAKFVYMGPQPGGAWHLEYSEAASLGTEIYVTSGRCLGVE